MSAGMAYETLILDTLPERLKSVSALAAQVGGDPGAWQVEEIGDGNLNPVFIVTGPGGKAHIKQALPDVRLGEDNWPMQRRVCALGPDFNGKDVL